MAPPQDPTGIRGFSGNLEEPAKKVLPVEYLWFGLVLLIIAAVVLIRRRRRDPGDENANLPPCCRP